MRSREQPRCETSSDVRPRWRRITAVSILTIMMELKTLTLRYSIGKGLKAVPLVSFESRLHESALALQAEEVLTFLASGGVVTADRDHGVLG